MDAIKKKYSFKQENSLYKLLELQTQLKKESSTKSLCKY